MIYSLTEFRTIFQFQERKMIMEKVPVMHLINQFFAGLGGEEKADEPSHFIEGPIGPGKRLQALLGDSAEIVVTAFCGDDYFPQHQDETVQKISEVAKSKGVRMLVAGPAFAAGRYGHTCVEICNAMTKSMGIYAITAMYIENPGLEAYRRYKNRRVFALPATTGVTGMEEALVGMAKFVLKLASGAPIHSASEEGYIARGIRTVEVVDRTGAQRGIDLLLAKITGRPFTTEIPLEKLEKVPIADPIADLAKSTIAIMTTSGVVLQGNPDGFKTQRNVQWKKYSIEKLNSMEEKGWDVRHGGYNNVYMLANPNYGVPLDACRELEKANIIGRLYPFFYATPGINGLVSVMKQLGKEMALDMKAEGVNGVLLVAT